MPRHKKPKIVKHPSHDTLPPLKLQTTTFWDYPSQNYPGTPQGDRAYAGATPSYIIWNLLKRYTRKGAKVLDPMCGSGTTLDVCRDLDRRGMGFDMRPTRPDIQKADARDLPLESSSVHFVFCDPPYSTHLEYSNDEACLGRLHATDPEYEKAFRKVFAEVYRVLQNGGYFALYVSDSYEKKKGFFPIGLRMAAMVADLHFDWVDHICVKRYNQKLAKTN